MSVEFFVELLQQGLQLWAEGDNLRFRSLETLSPQLRDKIRQHKAEIMASLDPNKKYSMASFAQQRLWFLDQLEPNSPFYNTHLALRLTGVLDLAALEQSLAELVRRHESLRTTFASRGGQVYQVIAAPAPVSVTMTPLDAIAPHQRAERARAEMQAEAGRPFDLEHGPLLRARIWKISADEAVLLLAMHHIIADGWSVGIVFRELSALYAAFQPENPLPLPELPMQYADYANWQRVWLSSEELERQLAYWKRQLAGAPARLELPTDRPRPPVQTYNGQALSFELGPALTAQLRALSRQAGASLFMTLYAAFTALLYRYTGQADILIGTPIAGRNRQEIEPLIGFFVNTLVLRADLSGVPTFRDLLAQARQTTLDAYAHQDIPFEQLVDELKPDRTLSASPLFQVMFVLQNVPEQEIELPGLTITPMELASHTAKFDLTLVMAEAEHGLAGALEYNRDLFEAATVTHMVDHFKTLLAGLVAEPGHKIADLPLLTEAEQRQMLVEWNDTGAEYPRDKCAHQLFTAQVEQTPDAIAVAFEDQHMTYRALNARAGQLAHALQALGIGPETLVGLCVERSLEMITGLLGILQAGGAYVPLDPTYPPERLAFMLQDARIPILLTQHKLSHLTSNFQSPIPTILYLDTDWDGIALPTGAPPASALPSDRLSPDRPSSDSLAYVIYTSGSTGQPKGVMISHRALVSYAQAMTSVFEQTRPPRVLQFVSIGFDAAAEEIFPTLLSGATLVVPAAIAELSERQFTRLCVQQHITLLHLPVSYWHQWVDLLTETNTLPPPSLETVMVGGEIPDPHRLCNWGRLANRPVGFLNAYGPTEATITTTFYRTQCDAAGADEPLPIGRPIANRQIYIVDQNLQLAPAGVPGELCIGGAGLARGYLDRPDLTAERFIPNPFPLRGEPEEGGRLYRTGDLARYRPSGDIEFLGRLDHQVKLRGFRIELGEIEAVLARHPAVRRAVVLLREDQPGHKQLVAYVVAPSSDEAGHAPPDILRAHLRQTLPDYMLPAAFVFLEALPLTPNGKVDRRALPAPDRQDIQDDHVASRNPASRNPASRNPASRNLAPRNPTEDVLVAIWAEVLGLERVGIHDNFFELGGHSLLATQVVSRLREAFQVEAPVRRLFEAPTIAELGATLAGRQAEARLLAPPVVPIPRADCLPLSFAQQRLWFLDQLEGPSPTYNIPAGLRLAGRLDAPALERSLNAILSRHEALRTTFAAVDGQPASVIAPALALRLPVIDLQSLPPTIQAAELERLATQESLRPFDLAAGPLLCAILIKTSNPQLSTRTSQLVTLNPQLSTSDPEHIFLLTMHHIVSDGWSMGLFFQDLHALYIAFSAGQPSPLPELPVQYADYAVWQRTWLSGEVLERQLAYWKRQLAGAPAVLELPTDRPRPAVQTFNGQTASFELGSTLTAQLHVLSRQAGVSLFMTLYAAFAAMLYRYTGQEDIVMGSPIAGRNRREIEPIIGLFVNTLVLRTNLSGSLTFRDLLAQVRQTTLDAYAHQDIPFEQLVDELQPARTLSYSPLVQVMFVLQNAPVQDLGLPGLTVAPLEQASRTAKFDLTLFMEESEQGLRGIVEYNTDLFEAATVSRMVEHWRTWLEGIGTDPRRRLADLPLLTEAERRQALVEWNATQSEYPHDKCIHQLFEAQVEQTPEAVAVVFEDQHLTYRALNARANQLAHYLQTQGVGPDVPVNVCMERSLEMVIGLYATLKSGGAYLPLEPSYPQDRLTFMLEDAQAPVVLTQSALRGLKLDSCTGRSETCPSLDTDWETIARHSSENPLSGVTGENLAYVIYTSGSTGKPKGVMNTHAGICNRLAWMQDAYRLTADDRVMQKTPFGFDVSVWEFFWPLLAGSCLVVARPEGHKDSAYLVELIADQQITTLHFVPSMFQVFLAEQHLERCDCLKRVICSGEALSFDLQERFFACMPAHVELHNLYGPTEAAVDVTSWACRREGGRRSVPIGRPIANIQIYLLDAQLQPVPVGVPGELHIGGVGLARGYLNRPDLTASRFIPDPFSQESGTRLYKTGDLGRFLPDGAPVGGPNGAIEFLGRADFQVKLRGFRIELGEIEAVLAQHPAVREAVVLLREDQPGRKQLVAYTVCQPTHDAGCLTPDVLRAHLKQTLPDYMLPAAFVFLETLPLTPNGKVDRRALPAPDRPGVQENYVAPRTPTEEVLAAIWAEVLGLEQVGIHDNFFELGGHSLLATRIISRLRVAFQVELPVRCLFEAPTLAELSALIAGGQAERQPPDPPVVPAPRTGRLPLSFAQQRLWFLDQMMGPGPTYNIPSALRLVGRLDVPALEKALNAILRRHEALRTCFASVDGQPVQVIAPGLALVLPVVNLQSLSPTVQEAELERLVIQETQCPFDLSTGPLLRAALIKTSTSQLANPNSQLATPNSEHIFLLTMHHIVSDAWSMGVFFQELGALYAAFVAGRPSPLPELPIQYADYAAWQRGWLSGEALERQLAYWKRQLAGAPALLELPTDRPRPSVQTYNGQTLSFELEPALTAQLRALSRQAGASLFMTLYAALAAMLYRYTGQADILIGAPIAGRNRQEIEALIGFFVNTLVLRADLSGAPTFRDLLAQARQVTLDAYTHQDIPYEQLVDELKPERTLSYSPLFQVMFTLQNGSGPGLELPGLATRPMELASSTAKFDLTLTMTETGQGLAGGLAYNRDLFEAATIMRMVDHFKTLLAGIVAEPGCKVTDLPLLTKAEHRQLLVEWNAAQGEYLRDKCVHELFEAQAEQTPQAVAVVFEKQHYTYQELNRRANQLAHYLRSLGVRAESRVGLFMERSLDIVVGLLGILKAGGAYVPIDPVYPQERIGFMLQEVQGTILLTQSPLAAAFSNPGDVQVICIDSDWRQIAQQSDENPRVALLPSNLMYVLFTSGSTGRPKAVALEHRNYVHYLGGVLQRLDLPAGSSYAIVSTFAADLGSTMIYSALCSGGQLHVISYERATDPPALADYFRQHPIDAMKIVPSHFEAMQALPNPADVIPRRRLIFAGEACRWDTVEQVRALIPDQVIHNHYGPTETAVSVLAYPIPAGIPHPPTPTVPLGYPLGNSHAYILDARGQPVPIGVTGEVYIGGGGVSRGYLNRPELTAERFVPDPFSSLSGKPGAGGDRLYRTGDLAHYLPSGAIEFLGRADFQVKVRGFRVELGEIEVALSQHAAVRQAVVLLREDRPQHKQLVAYIVRQAADEAKRLTSDMVRAHLKQSLPDYMLPPAFIFLDTLPLTPNGKLDRRALPAPGEPDIHEGAVSPRNLAPRNPTEEALAAIWAEALGLNQVGIHDNFFELGGHSLLAVRIVARVRAHFDRPLSLVDLFKYPTICQLAEIVFQEQPKKPGLLHELTRPTSQAKVLSLVCTPYAGGSAVVYQPLADALPPNCSLYAVQLPGHDYAYPEQPLLPLEMIAQQCVEEIRQTVHGPLVLYGHSAGGALTIEIARRLEPLGIEVVGVVLGAQFPRARPPSKLFEWLYQKLHMDRWVSDRAIYETHRAAGGFTEEMSPQETDFVVHSMRHDAQESENYYTQAYTGPPPGRLKAPILSVIAERDRGTELYEERFREWGYFSDTVDLAVIPQAGHYFLKHQAAELARMITRQVDAWQGKTTETPHLAAKPKRAHEPAAAPSRQTIAPSMAIFLIVALGQFVSVIGTHLTSFALGVWVFQRTHSVTDFSMISTFALVPGLLFLPIAGAVADRWDRRWIMILSDTLAACGTLLVAGLLWTGSLQVWHIYITASLGAIANAFQGPAYTAAISQLVPKQYLGHASGIGQLGLAAGALLSPLLGGVLVVSIGLYGVVLIDFATFLFSMATLWAIRFPDTLFKKREEPFRTEMVGGVRYILKRRSFLIVSVFFLVLNFWTAIARVPLTPLVLSYASSAELGIVMAASGVGLLLGSLSMSVWGGTRRRMDGLLGFGALLGPAILILGVRPSPVSAAIGLFGWGFCLSLINAHWYALLQTKVGLELQGRVLALERLLYWSMIPIGYLLAGALADQVFEPLMLGGGPLAQILGRLMGAGPGRGMALVVTVGGLGMLMTGIVGLRYRPLRYMEDDLPDAIPDAVILADKDALQERADRQLATKALP